MKKMKNNIKEKVVVITGASNGIGKATAILLAELGAKIVMGARNLDRLQILAEKINKTDGEALYLSIDVKKRDDLVKLVDFACEKYGKIDVLINNAGIGPLSPLDDLRVEEWEDMIDINIKGVLYGIAAALPLFRIQNFGHFINIASTAAHKTVVNQSVYSATKFAVRALSEGLRQEVGDKIKVTIISPGFINTTFVDTVTNTKIKEELISLRDKFAISPNVIAEAIVYAIDQPTNVDVNEIIIRPTAQG